MIVRYFLCLCFCFFKHKTAYEMRISDWSSDVCSSDLPIGYKRNGWRGEESANVAHAFFAQFLNPLLRIFDGLLSLRRFSLALGYAGIPFGQIGRASCRERVCQYV